jgi:hypothetical protein
MVEIIIHPHFEIRHFANPEDRKHTQFRTTKSKTPIRWKAPVWGRLMSFQHIAGQESELREFRGKEPIRLLVPETAK